MIFKHFQSGNLPPIIRRPRYKFSTQNCPKQNFCQSFLSLKEALHYFKNIGANTKATQHNNFSHLIKQKNFWQQQANLDWQVSFFLAKKIS